MGVGRRDICAGDRMIPVLIDAVALGLAAFFPPALIVYSFELLETFVDSQH